jgi:putative glutamine amidotransferase
VTASPTIILGWPKTDYSLSIETAGGVPRVITPDKDTVDAALDAADGLLLTGGADVDPRQYGVTERHPTVSVVPERDEYEIQLARGAMARDLPILAICRGIQLLNVAAGGSLVQDLPSERPSMVRHRVKEPEAEKVHTIQVVPRSLLASALELEASDGALAVNSRHHQAVDRVAPGFVVSAEAPDGVIEAVECPARTFCLGVQWHPENYWATGDFAHLFAAFTDAARRYRARKI